MISTRVLMLAVLNEGDMFHLFNPEDLFMFLRKVDDYSVEIVDTETGEILTVSNELIAVFD